MAGAGEFPKTTGDLIYAADYNTIRNIAVDVVSTTYGNSVSSAAVGAEVITAAQMDNLRNDLERPYKHITGAFYNLTDVGATDTITHGVWNAYKTVADYISANRYVVNASQLTLASETNTLGAGWNGDHVFWRRYTWASAAAKDYWFNTGGYFLVGVAGNGSDGSSKANDWQNNILEAMPDQTYGRAQYVSGTPNYTVTEYGNVAQYTENFCSITFSHVSSTQFDISVRIYDVDSGDQTGLGPAVDENVGCNAGAAINNYTSFDAITAAAPSVSAIQNW